MASRKPPKYSLVAAEMMYLLEHFVSKPSTSVQFAYSNVVLVNAK